MAGFAAFGNDRLGRFGQRPQGARRLAIEGEAVGVVPRSLERCASQQAVGRESLTIFRETQVTGNDGGGCFVAPGDEIVQVLVGGRPNKFQTEVLDDQQRYACEARELALVGAGRANGVQSLGEAGAQFGGDVDTLSDGMAEGLPEMALADAARTDDVIQGFLLQTATALEVMYDCPSDCRGDGRAR